MCKLLVNRTDEFDRYHVELIRKEVQLTILWIYCLQKICNTIQVVGCRVAFADEGGNMSPLNVCANHSNRLVVADRSRKIAGSSV